MSYMHFKPHLDNFNISWEKFYIFSNLHVNFYPIYRLECYPCLAGYYCPPGTGYGDTYPCGKGYYCPPESAEPIPCPIGMYGDIYQARTFSECKKCPNMTYGNERGMTQCKRCGSHAYSHQGWSTCKCQGKYRSFQPSGGACVCWTGYYYYDEADRQVRLRFLSFIIFSNDMQYTI